MGVLEDGHKRRLKRDQIRHAILASVASTGLLSLALVAPNSLKILCSFNIDEKLRRKFDKDKSPIYYARRQLVKSGLLEYKDSFLVLTQKGREKLRYLEMRNFKIDRPKKWDKKWRMLIFDIKENRRNIRDRLRATLTSVGFVWLQNSVWVYPYPCEDFVTLLKADFKLGKELLYLIVDTVENDKNLREVFGLNGTHAKHRFPRPLPPGIPRCNSMTIMSDEI